MGVKKKRLLYSQSVDKETETKWQFQGQLDTNGLGTEVLVFAPGALETQGLVDLFKLCSRTVF